MTQNKKQNILYTYKQIIHMIIIINNLLPTGNVKKLMPNFFDKFNQLQWVKPYVEFNTHKKRIEAEHVGYKDGKAFHKLMNNGVYGKTMEKLRNRIDVRLVSNIKDSLEWKSKPSYVMKISDNDLQYVKAKLH